MTEYLIRGLHCRECAHELEEKLNKFIKTDSIRIDYDQRKAMVPHDVDMEQLKRIEAFEKVTFESINHSKKAKEKNTHHSHDHHHSHEENFSSGETAAKNIKIVFFVNLFFSLVEFIFGFLFNSLAILTDAVHDLGDAVSIGLAWFFQKISVKEANEKYTFGHQRFSLLGALITGIVLLAGSVMVILNVFPRLADPQPVHYQGMFWMSIFAIAANGYSAWLLSKGKSANESMLNLHMLEDILGWIGVLIVSVVVRYTNWYILDPLLSMAIAVYIIWGTWPQFKKAIEIFLDVVPESIEMEDIEKDVTAIEEIQAVSHLHIWSIDGQEHAMTVTISTNNLSMGEQEQVKNQIRQIIAPYNVTHSTIEFVSDPERLLE